MYDCMGTGGCHSITLQRDAFPLVEVETSHIWFNQTRRRDGHPIKLGVNVMGWAEKGPPGRQALLQVRHCAQSD
jgi:hypothetical protein